MHFSNTQTLSTDNRHQSQSTFRLLFFLLPTNVLLRIRPVKKCWIFAVDRPIRHHKVKWEKGWLPTLCYDLCSIRKPYFMLGKRWPVKSLLFSNVNWIKNSSSYSGLLNKRTCTPIYFDQKICPVWAYQRLYVY